MPSIKTISEKVKKIKDEEKNKNKTDTGQVPDSIEINPEKNSFVSQNR